MPTISSQIDVNLSAEVKQVLHIADCKAREYLHASYGAPHLLWALLNKEISTYQLLRDCGKDIFNLQEWASVRLEEYPKANRTITEVEASKELTEILNEADQLRFEFKHNEVEVICLLAVICIPGLAFSYDQLKTLPLSKKEILQSVYGETLPANNEQAENATSLLTGNNYSDTSLNEYCHNKHKEVSEKNHFQLIERKEEIKTCLEILSRYTKANLILIGEPGVGKTALIDGLVEQVDKENVPENLKHTHLLELDVAAMQAGASYKGELEDRFQKIINELKNFDKPVLLIDDIHVLMDKQNNLSSLSNLLLLELNRGDVTIIGTTTPEKFRKTIEKDETFTRRFETLRLEEPNDEVAATIIRTVIKPQENHHNLHIRDTAIKEAIRLSKRYDKERHLPDAAIDLIDRCMARVRITVNRSDSLLKELKEGLKQYQNSDKTDPSEVRKQYTAFLDASDRLLKDHYGLTLKDQTNLEDDDAFVFYLDKIITEIDTFEGEAKKIINADLAEIISRKTGIPTGKIQAQERKRLLGMEEALRQRVVGQDSALKSVSEAVLESRSGLMKSGQPIGSFFLLGPTGTGKTELAKALSEFLFQDEQSMIRFDMSEFKEEHSAALLYGSPPGYVGYEEGGMLVNKIREKPYSVVLFDEIEKAHSSVFDIFLQILDEGKLNDRLGKEGDFSNAVVLFTSNIASEYIPKVFGEEGRLPSSQQLMEKLSGHFRPEFLGRLTEIVPFGPISEEVLLRIFEIHLAELLQASTRKGIIVELGIETKKYLAHLGYSPQYGARPINGVIRDKIRRPLSRMLIEGKIESGSRVQLSLDNNHQLQWKVNQNK